MSQHDFSIANQTASSARTDINNALQALASCSSGATAPSTTYANMLWYDTANNTLKIRNEADSAWLSIAYVDQTDGAEIFDDTKVVNSSGTQTGLIGDQAEATWETGTGTTESLVSPAKVKAAIDANTSTGVGISQSWQNPSRSVNTSYQNTTGQPIMVTVAYSTSNTAYLQVSTDNSSWITVSRTFQSGTHPAQSFIVPDDHYYRLSGSGVSVLVWAELR